MQDHLPLLHLKLQTEILSHLNARAVVKDPTLATFDSTGPMGTADNSERYFVATLTLFLLCLCPATSATRTAPSTGAAAGRRCRTSTTSTPPPRRRRRPRPKAATSRLRPRRRRPRPSDLASGRSLLFSPVTSRQAGNVKAPITSFHPLSESLLRAYLCFPFPLPSFLSAYFLFIYTLFFFSLCRVSALNGLPFSSPNLKFCKCFYPFIFVKDKRQLKK